ncbi:MAG: hypothetical protein BM558_13210 [Roseobacter sp. MedPE-SW]|nr:MAG: hypothetical protein BM558_13210 [Roseobacter sp. MedPE-SW]
MNTITKKVFALVGLLFLAACAGDSTTSQSAIIWKNAYSLTDATVTMSENVRIQNIPQLPAEQKAELKQVFPTHMATILNANARPAFKGTIPAKLDVTVHGLTVPTGTGRAFGGSAFISTTARLLDPKTGKVLETQALNVEQGTFRGGGLFMPVMLAVNSGTTKEQRYQELSAKYAENLLLVSSTRN